MTIPNTASPTTATPTVASPSTPIIPVRFDRRHIRSLDFGPLYEVTPPVEAGHSTALREAMGRVVFIISPDSDPWNAPFRQRTQFFFHELHREWPYMFHFCNLNTKGLAQASFGVVNTRKHFAAGGRFHQWFPFDREIWRDYLYQSLSGMVHAIRYSYPVADAHPSGRPVTWRYRPIASAQQERLYIVRRRLIMQYFNLGASHFSQSDSILTWEQRLVEAL